MNQILYSVSFVINFVGLKNEPRNSRIQETRLPAFHVVLAASQQRATPYENTKIEKFSWIENVIICTQLSYDSTMILRNIVWAHDISTRNVFNSFWAEQLGQHHFFAQIWFYLMYLNNFCIKKFFEAKIFMTYYILDNILILGISKITSIISFLHTIKGILCTKGVYKLNKCAPIDVL